MGVGTALLIIPIFAILRWISAHPRTRNFHPADVAKLVCARSCCIVKMMASKVQVSAKLEEKSPGLPYAALILGWLVPGLGPRPYKALDPCGASLRLNHQHVHPRRHDAGQLYQPNAGDVLEMLGFAGDLGCGALYILGRIMDLGPMGAVQVATADYGTKFIVVAGLLNIISASTRTIPHRQEGRMLTLSHFSAVLLFATFASVVFGITQRTSPKLWFGTASTVGPCS